MRFLLLKSALAAQLPAASAGQWDRGMTVNQGRGVRDPEWAESHGLHSVRGTGSVRCGQGTSRGFPMTSGTPGLGVAMWARALWHHSHPWLSPRQPCPHRSATPTVLCSPGQPAHSRLLEGGIWNLRKKQAADVWVQNQHS